MNQRVLAKMNFRYNSHNQVSFDHLEGITEFLESNCPIRKEKAIAMMRLSVGLGDRIVKDYVKSLEAWEVIRIKNGTIEWILDKIIIPDMKNEDVPDTFPGTVGEVLPPCRHRPKDIYEQCNPSEGIFVSSKKQRVYCTTCAHRYE